MCKFCDDLEWREYKIPYRTCSADDNRCEYGSPDIVNDGENEYILGSTCEDCSGCAEDNLYFSIRTYQNRIGLDFTHRIKNLIIEPCSEMVDINFCPWCGKQLNDVVQKAFKKALVISDSSVEEKVLCGVDDNDLRSASKSNIYEALKGKGAISGEKDEW